MTTRRVIADELDRCPNCGADIRPGQSVYEDAITGNQYDTRRCADRHGRHMAEVWRRTIRRHMAGMAALLVVALATGCTSPTPDAPAPTVTIAGYYADGAAVDASPGHAPLAYDTTHGAPAVWIISGIEFPTDTTRPAGIARSIRDARDTSTGKSAYRCVRRLPGIAVYLAREQKEMQ